MMVYKSSTRQHLDYDDIFYYQAYNVSFIGNYNAAALAIIVRLWGTSKEKALSGFKLWVFATKMLILKTVIFMKYLKDNPKLPFQIFRRKQGSSYPMRNSKEIPQ